MSSLSRLLRWPRAFGLALLLLPLAGVPATPGGGLPNLGGAGDLPISEERHIGDQIAREIYRDPDYLDDPVVMEYVSGIFQSLLAAARQRGEISPEMNERFAWEVMLQRDRSVNAFALPGGYMGMNLGMISLVANSDELASVMGHELSHMTQRHISRNASRQGAQTAWIMGTMILGALAASKNPDLGSAIFNAGPAAAMQTQLNYSRDNEREADRVGFGVMTQAGYAPQGFTAMFEKLQQAYRLVDNGSYPYLRTHPLTTERIADMQLRIAPGPNGAPPPPPAAANAMLAARARALLTPGLDTLHIWVDDAQSSSFDDWALPRKLGVLYAAVLADMRLRDYAAAQPLLTRMSSLSVADPAAARLTRLLTAEVALAQGDGAATLAALGTVKPSGRAELLLQAQAQMRMGQANAAAQNLQTWTSTHARDATAWMTLAAAYTAQSQRVRALRAEAEAQVAHFDYPGALARLRSAQDYIKAAGAAQTNDYIEASIVDARARELESLAREQLSQR